MPEALQNSPYVVSNKSVANQSCIWCLCIVDLSSYNSNHTSAVFLSCHKISTSTHIPWVSWSSKSCQGTMWWMHLISCQLPDIFKNQFIRGIYRARWHISGIIYIHLREVMWVSFVYIVFTMAHFNFKTTCIGIFTMFAYLL